MKSLSPFSSRLVIAGASAPTNIGISARWASTMLTMVFEENTVPRKTYGLPSAMSATTCFETSGSAWVSWNSGTIWHPRMPPASLISATAISRPSRQFWPAGWLASYGTATGTESPSGHSAVVATDASVVALSVVSAVVSTGASVVALSVVSAVVSTGASVVSPPDVSAVSASSSSPHAAVTSVSAASSVSGFDQRGTLVIRVSPFSAWHATVVTEPPGSPT